MSSPNNATASNAELLLTSGGVTTDAMRERMFAMSKIAGAKNPLRIVRIADGWRPFQKDDPVSLAGRVEQYVGGQSARIWSGRYLRWVIGNRASIHTVTLGSKTPDTVQKLLKSSDLLVVPGGNTYQTIRGINAHRLALTQAVNEGLPYLGESAGSIVAGRSLRPASLEPADTCPDESLKHAPGLGFINADIVVHTAGSQERFDVPGPLARLTKLALDSIASDPSLYIPENDTVAVHYLNERQALYIHSGQVELV